MKKQILKKTLILKKKTIANLSQKEMTALLAGARASQIGQTCYTAACCIE